MDQIKIPIKRKPRIKETKPRKREEAEFRPIAIKALEKKGYIVKRIENGICGQRGDSIPDLWVFHRSKPIAGFIELKTPVGVLSLGQKDFQQRCINCKISHWVIRSLEEIEAWF